MTHLSCFSTRSLTGLLGLTLLMAAGCDSPSPADDAGPSPDASSFDAGMSSADTGPSVDAAGRDGAAAPDAAVRTDAWRGDGGMPLEQVREFVCEPLANALCTSPWDCGCREAATRPGDVAACVAVQTEACMTSFVSEGPGAAIVSGDARLDEAALMRCRAFLGQAYGECTATMLDFLAVCLTAFVSDAPLGSGCTPGALCAGGEGFCTDTCAPLPRLGERCDSLGLPLCVGGLACRGGVCSMPGAMGEPCAIESDCGEGLHCLGDECRPYATTPCVDTVECAAGQRCVGGACADATDLTCEGGVGCPSLSECIADTARRCAAPAALGGRCDHPDGCVAGAVCDFAASECVREPTFGEACDGACAAGLICVFDTFTCVAAPGEGEPCRSAFAGSGCAEGLGCFSGTCGRLTGEGSLCADGGECPEGLVCVGDVSGNTCVGPRGAGDRCDDGLSDPCADGLYCERPSGVCAARVGAGAPCDFDVCLPGLDCMFDDVGRGTCQAIPGIGEDCGRLCAGDAVCTDVPLGGVCRPRVCDHYPEFDR